MLVLFNVLTLFIISHECDIITKTLLFYLLAINWMILGNSILFSELTVFILLRLQSKSRLWGLSGECVMCRNTHLWYMPIAIAEQLCQMGLQIIDDGFQSRISRRNLDHKIYLRKLPYRAAHLNSQHKVMHISQFTTILLLSIIWNCKNIDI